MSELQRGCWKMLWRGTKNHKQGGIKRTGQMRVVGCYSSSGLKVSYCSLGLARQSAKRNSEIKQTRASSTNHFYCRLIWQLFSIHCLVYLMSRNLTDSKMFISQNRALLKQTFNSSSLFYLSCCRLEKNLQSDQILASRLHLDILGEKSVTAGQNLHICRTQKKCSPSHQDANFGVIWEKNGWDVCVLLPHPVRGLMQSVGQKQ